MKNWTINSTIIQCSSKIWDTSKDRLQNRICVFICIFICIWIIWMCLFEHFQTPANLKLSKPIWETCGGKIKRNLKNFSQASSSFIYCIFIGNIRRKSWKKYRQDFSCNNLTNLLRFKIFSCIMIINLLLKSVHANLESIAISFMKSHHLWIGNAIYASLTWLMCNWFEFIFKPWQESAKLILCCVFIFISFQICLNVF